MALRDYQQKLSDEIDVAIANGARSILATCATGGGKTHLISHRAKLANGPTLDIAHRQELLFQISMALARDGIDHRLLAPPSVCNFIIEKQIETYKRIFIHGSARHTVAGVDMLIARADRLDKQWLAQVKLVQIDEGHHCLPDNKWGRALTMFPDALKIAWTGTGRRGDGKSLRGIFDTLVRGPNTRELLEMGHLCPYRIYGPPPSIDMEGAPVGASGDFSPVELRKRAHKSKIVGDAVEHYLKLTPGQVGLCFNVDIEQAKESAERFNAAGVPAVAMSSRETDDRVRVRNLEALRRGELRMICNVDLLGEGVDVPRVEVIVDARPTKSLPRYLQLFGRLLRTYPGKTVGTYLDLVGNVIRHRRPDLDHLWSLDAPEKRKRLENDEFSLTACPQCFQVFERFLLACPNCGCRPETRSVARGELAQVQGDLTQYSPELLDELSKDAEEIMQAAPRGNVPAYIERNWNERAVAQDKLREALHYWLAVQTEKVARPVDEAYRLFWHRFGIDVATAKTLGRKQAEELTVSVWGDTNERIRPFSNGVASVVVEAEKKPRGVNPYFDKQIEKWGCVYRINGKNKTAYAKTKDECQILCDWVNANPNQILPESLHKPRTSRGIVNPSFVSKYRNWLCRYRINGKSKDAITTTKDECQILCDWVNANPNQILPLEIYTPSRKIGVTNPLFDKRRKSWICEYRVNKKKKTYCFKSKDECQILCDWVNANPNQMVPDNLRSCHSLKRQMETAC